MEAGPTIIMMLENQAFHYGTEDETTKAKIKRDFLEMFFPSDPAWRSKAGQDAERILALVLERLKSPGLQGPTATIK